MDGINALPRWDPSNPTKYAYDAKNYNAADYEAFKQARLAFTQQRTNAAAERNKQVMKEANQAIKDKLKEEKQKGSGQKRLSLDQIKTAAKAGKTIWADAASECFAELSWRNGIAHAEFNKRNPDGGYDYEVDLETFLEWASDSLGEFFNAEIR
jgi:hypothetical protein